ncbi:MAG TPA: CoA-acylating methylmalonate-semialdehyde dehydrogenase [Thermoplasmata archaeon]|nr:CoA-acylating methylmalonate-semialdehyde dehydrogenase [Thermoplasmata archaeon]
MGAARRLENFIGGVWVASGGPDYLDVPNPATGELLARVPLSTATDVDRAVAAAADALPPWREVPVVERARLVLRLRELLIGRLDELARLVVSENGKSLSEAEGSIRRGIETTEFAASAPTVLQGSVLENVARGIDTELIRQPVGVVAGITPFNFPVMIPLWMLPLALVCGNTFVLKPSERVPQSADLLVRLFAEAGFPAGTVNLVHGTRDAVHRLLTHPAVAAISFVGSAPTAEYVYRTGTGQGKRVQALAGAKNHLVVMPDAELEPSVGAIVSSAFGQAGERCLAGSVVLAVEPVGDRLVAALADRVSRLSSASGDIEGGVGPLIRPDLRDRVLGYIERGVAEGATLAARGRPSESGGYFVAPVLFDHVRPEMAIAREEIFGPVLAVIRVRDLGEAIDIANRSRFGNAAAIFTRDGGAAREFRHRIEAGMLGINVGVPAPAAYFPFVGWKGSFFGDLHATGRDAFEFYSRKKVVTSRWF